MRPAPAQCSYMCRTRSSKNKCLYLADPHKYNKQIEKRMGLGVGEG